jgi:REP element-mobilizing transposase RayT
LCGEDKYSGKSFSHRRQWMVDRIRQLSDIFAINICAYSILSNHYHIVLHANEVEIEACSDEDVCKRWYQLYSGSPIVSRWIKGELTTEAEVNVALEVITKWRHRLIDISWFMRSLNEFIARKANKEDNCKGRFWEGRFKSQALLDEKALLTCMAYVDLNPVRAKMAESVEKSEYTSVFERIHGSCCDEEKACSNITCKPLFCFVVGECNDQSQGIPYALINYLELVDWTGRVIRDDKRGAISAQIPCLLSTLGLDSETWLELASSFGKNYHGAVGSLDELALFAEHTGKRWISGKTKLQRMLH